MTPQQILLLFFGLPLSVLTIGMRRGLGFLGLGKVLLSAGITMLVGWVWMRALGHPLSISGGEVAPVRWIGVVYLLGSVIIGSLSGALVRLQGHGVASEEHSDSPAQSISTKGPAWLAAGFLAAVFVALVSGLIGVELRRYGFLPEEGGAVILGMARIDLSLVVPLGFLSGALSARFLGPPRKAPRGESKGSASPPE